MASNEADVVVVGAGIAGLVCAAELLREGLTPILICETPEVGWAIRAVKMGENGRNRGFVQHPLHSPGLNGGAWYSAARFLNVPVSYDVSPPMHLLNRGTGQTAKLKACASATAVADLFATIAPIPIDDQRDGIIALLHRALMLSWEELAGLQRTPLADWLEGEGSDPVLAMAMYVLAANLTETTAAAAAEHVSVYGMMAMLRGLVCGEALVTAPSPDPWEGLAVPLGKGLDANGCTVMRGAKVDRVIVEDGRAVGVALVNGDEVRGKAVALAVGNPRITGLLESVPPEIQVALDYAEKLLGHDACTYTLTDKPVVPIKNLLMVADEFGNNEAYLFPMHAVAPSSCEPGKYLLAAQVQMSKEDYVNGGGHDGAIKRLLAVQEELFPGLEAATIERKEQTHKHHWLNPLTHGPKLPAQSADIPGLYFAGDGSTPIVGIGVDGAGQAGLLRARRIAADLRG
jgi:phytoene dehydrogenase-like protein